MLRLTAFPVRYPNPWQPTRRPPRGDNRGSIEVCIARTYPGHNAVDILGDLGLIVASATDGWLANCFIDIHGHRHRGGVGSGSDGGGNFVVIIDDAGFMHYYAHLLKPAFIAGSRVAAGQQIGLLGRSGNAGLHPHLHYQVSAPRPETSADGTNGFSTDDRGRRREEAALRAELERLSRLQPVATDRFHRIVIPPKVALPPIPRDHWVG